MTNTRRCGIRWLWYYKVWEPRSAYYAELSFYILARYTTGSPLSENCGIAFRRYSIKMGDPL